MGIVKKALLTLALLLALAAVLLPAPQQLLFENTFFTRMDQVGTDYLDESLKRAAAAFALTRAINAGISILQESQVQATLFGAGLTLAVGQVLDPVNDLIERFSWVLLASMTSLGLQKFFMAFGAWLSVQIILAAALAVLAVGIWLPHRARFLVVRGGVKLALIAIMLRFFIPLAGWANLEIYNAFLEQDYEQSITHLEVEELNDVTNTESGLWKDLRNMEIEDRLARLKEKMVHLTGYVVNLMIVFTIQNVALPLLTLWLLVKALQFLAAWKTPAIPQPPIREVKVVEA